MRGELAADTSRERHRLGQHLGAVIVERGVERGGMVGDGGGGSDDGGGKNANRIPSATAAVPGGVKASSPNYKLIASAAPGGTAAQSPSFRIRTGPIARTQP